MGYNKRRDQRDAMAELRKENQYIRDMNLASLCSAGIVKLNVCCQNCPRRGRYRVTRLVDRYGFRFGLPDLKRTLSQDCRESWRGGCAVYFLELSSIRMDRPIGS